MIRCDPSSWSDADFCTRVLATKNSGIFDSNDDIGPAIEAGQLAYDEAAFRTCLDDISQFSCDVQITDLRTQFESCRAALVGQIPDGGQCRATLACPADAACIPPEDYSQCFGTCRTIGVGCYSDGWCTDKQICGDHQTCRLPDPPPGALGQPCGENNLCEGDLACLSDGAGGYTCQPANGDNGDCGQNFQCADGTFCDYQTRLCKSDVEVAELKENEACPSDYAIADAYCGPGLICVPDDGDTSSARCMKLKKRGEPCSKLLECGDYNSDLICDAQSHVCAARPKSGLCPAIQFGGRCATFEAYCDTQTDPANPTCRPFKQAGQECVSGEECGYSWGQLDCYADDAASSVKTCHVYEGPSACETK
jgi:hypothetical protein